MIIFNADDYALTAIDIARVNNSVHDSVIQSTTAVANGIENIVADNINSLSTGIHINLVEGRSLTEVPTLTNIDGCFFSKFKLFRRLVSGQVCRKELEKEISAQFDKLRKSGIFISHIDTHQNIHIAPPILHSLIRVGQEFEVRKIRGQHSEYGWFGAKNSVKSHLKNAFAMYWHSLLPKKWLATERVILNAPGLGKNVSSISDAVAMWEMALKNFYVPSVIYEVPCHLYISAFEYELYRSPEFLEMIRRNRIEIGSYNDI